MAAQSATAGTVGCIKQGLADLFKPCEGTLLLGTIESCLGLLANIPDTAGISGFFAIPVCSAAANMIVQALVCDGLDCAVNQGSNLAPVIDDVNPKYISVGQNSLLTIHGQNFQPNFSARVIVGGQTLQINSGPQTVFVNPNRVLVRTLIGGSASTLYGVQIVNPDNQTSNTFGGLIASAGQQGGNQGNTQVQISFAPNPVNPSSTSDCSRAYFFTVEVKNTGTNPVTFAHLDVDSFQNLALNQIGFQNQVGPGSQFQVGIKYCRGSGSTTWTLHSDEGAAWSGTAQLQ